MWRKNNKRELPKGIPKWFQEWYLNDFLHMVRDVWWIKTLVIIMLGALLTAIIAKII